MQSSPSSQTISSSGVSLPQQMKMLQESFISQCVDAANCQGVALLHCLVAAADLLKRIDDTHNALMVGSRERFDPSLSVNIDLTDDCRAANRSFGAGSMEGSWTHGSTVFGAHLGHKRVKWRVGKQVPWEMCWYVGVMRESECQKLVKTEYNYESSACDSWGFYGWSTDMQRITGGASSWQSTNTSQKQAFSSEAEGAETGCVLTLDLSAGRLTLHTDGGALLTMEGLPVGSGGDGCAYRLCVEPALACTYEEEPVSLYGCEVEFF
eukprot:GDKI01027608.1.p1 GENE.GDKI01027608.1~~GDKI01027608.1.p1  ORF type:complete len:266 (+),score=67.61 GDKI01027608.1:139-936(+)